MLLRAVDFDGQESIIKSGFSELHKLVPVIYSRIFCDFQHTYRSTRSSLSYQFCIVLGDVSSSTYCLLIATCNIKWYGTICSVLFAGNTIMLLLPLLGSSTACKTRIRNTNMKHSPHKIIIRVLLASVELFWPPNTDVTPAVFIALPDFDLFHCRLRFLFCDTPFLYTPRLRRDLRRPLCTCTVCCTSVALLRGSRAGCPRCVCCLSLESYTSIGERVSTRALILCASVFFYYYNTAVVDAVWLAVLT